MTVASLREHVIMKHHYNYHYIRLLKAQMPNDKHGRVHAYDNFAYSCIGDLCNITSVSFNITRDIMDHYCVSMTAAS